MVVVSERGRVSDFRINGVGGGGQGLEVRVWELGVRILGFSVQGFGLLG